MNVLCMLGSDNSMYGHRMKKKFYLGSGFTNFNHGSFGTVPREVKAAQNARFEEAEEHLDKWFRVTYYKYQDQAREAVASLINAQVEDVVLVENASTAINAILRSLPWKKGDKVLVLSTVYSMVTNVLQWYVVTYGIEIVKVMIDFPVVDKRQILEAVGAAMAAHDNIKICVFSHVTSLPSLILPVEELVAEVKSSERNKNSLVLIDGAHAPGLVDINIERIGADYYTGNLHKWCFCPKGCAFMWVSKPYQDYKDLQPTVISSTGHIDYVARFSYTGTRDYTAFATITAAFAFVRSLGGHKSIFEYNNELILVGAQLCAQAWGTELMVPKGMIASMADVILPTTDEAKVRAMEADMQSKYNTFLIARDWKLADGRTVWITRLSAQIYLEKSDFEKLAVRVVEMLSR